MIEWLNHFGSQWLAYMTIAGIQNTIFLGFVFAALYFLRNSTAQIQYKIGAIGLGKLILPTIIPIPFFEWTLPQPLILENIKLIESATNSSTPPVPTVTSLDWTGLLFLIWLLLTGIILLIAVRSWLRLKRQLRDPQYLQSVCLGQRMIRIYQCGKINMPMTIGIFPKKIYVPPAWQQWSPECREMILAHELAHIQRYDGLIQILQMLIQALYWFHPLVWLLNRQLNEYREMACDDMSVANKQRASIIYSRYLVEIAENMVQSSLGCSSASALIRQKNNLLKRVIYQMKEVNMVPRSGNTIRFILVGLLLLVVPLSLNYGKAVPGKKGDENTKVVEISIKSDRTITVEGKPTSLSNLKQQLQEIVPVDPHNVVISIQADNAVTMETITEVQQTLRELNLLKINYQQKAPLVLPQSGMAEKLNKIPRKNVATILVTESGQILLDEEAVTALQIVERLKQRLSQNQSLVVSVRTAKNTTYNDYLAVLDQIRAAGVTRISVGDD